jgi:hypothetical protein
VNTREAEDPAWHFFRGTWATMLRKGKSSSGFTDIAIEFKTVGAAVTGEIRNAQSEKYPPDHIHLVQNSLSFTFRNREGRPYLAKALVDKDTMDLQIWGIEGFLCGLKLTRQ